MDAISVIVAALTAGALAGAQGTATQAVQDAYKKTKELTHRRFVNNAAGKIALDEHEKDPDAWERALAATLSKVGADADTELIAQSQALMKMVDPSGSRSGKYLVTIIESEKVQVGDGAIMINQAEPQPSTSGE